MKYRAVWTARLAGAFDVEAPTRLDAFKLAEDAVRGAIRIGPPGGVVVSYDVESLDEESPVLEPSPKI